MCVISDTQGVLALFYYSSLHMLGSSGYFIVIVSTMLSSSTQVPTGIGALFSLADSSILRTYSPKILPR